MIIAIDIFSIIIEFLDCNTVKNFLVLSKSIRKYLIEEYNIENNLFRNIKISIQTVGDIKLKKYYYKLFHGDFKRLKFHDNCFKFYKTNSIEHMFICASDDGYIKGRKNKNILNIFMRRYFVNNISIY